GAVILQGRGVATRRQMFDIAVSGPIAGLVVTIPVLLLGIYQSGYEKATVGGGLEFGEPLLLQWVIHWIHGPGLPGESFIITTLGLAGWVGVFITAMNLLPVGQLDGGHILYTLIGRKAHGVAFLVIAAGVAMMFIQETYTFSLLLILLMVTGLRHPPTANDSEPLGKGRTVLGWLTLSFLIIGFTPTPISQSDLGDAAAPTEQAEPVAADYGAEAI
ncbi:MAG: site-2 protease family protein, partial [Planctomycetaceae bacterium]